MRNTGETVNKDHAVIIWAKTWPGLVIPQKNQLLYNDGGDATRKTQVPYVECKLEFTGNRKIEC